MISTTRCPIFFNAVYITFNATYTFFHQSSLDCKICLSHFFNFFQLCRLPDLGKDGWAFFTPPLCRRLLCTTIRACLLTKKRKLKSVKIFLTIPSKKDLHVKLWNMNDENGAYKRCNKKKNNRCHTVKINQEIRLFNSIFKMRLQFGT